MLRHLKRLSGYVLITTMALLAVLSIVIFALARSGRLELQNARSQLRSLRALYAAESGIADSLVQLKSNPKLSEVRGSLPLGEGSPERESYRVVIFGEGQTSGRGVKVPAGCLYLESSGSYFGLTRQVGVTVRTGSSQFLRGALLVDELKLEGDSRVDSYDSSLGSYSAQAPGTQGNVYSNSEKSGSLVLTGSSKVKGSIYVGPGGLVGPPAPTTSTLNSQNTVWKDWGCSSLGEAALKQAMELPAVEVPDLGNSRGDRSFNYAGGQLEPGCYDNVETHDGTLVLPAGTYVVKTMRVSGMSSIVTDGEVRFYVQQSLKVEPGKINLEQKPARLTWALADQARAEFQGGSQGSMVCYGPGAEIVVSNGCQISGALVAHKASVSGGSRLHFDEKLLDYNPFGPGGASAGYTVLNWQRF